MRGTGYPPAHQHFANARVRAVEEGVPLVRSAYAGISGAVDSYGRIVGTIPLNQKGYFDFRARAARRSSGLCALWRYLVRRFLCVCSLVAIAVSRMNRRKSSPIIASQIYNNLFCLCRVWRR